MLHYLAKLQHCLPHYLISHLVHKLGQSKNTRFKDFFIKSFIKKFGIDLSLAERKAVEDYQSFNDFFTRHLDLNIRDISTTSPLISPADGTILTVGKIKNDAIFYAKGHQYNLDSLLGSKLSKQQIAKKFEQGSHFTIYLSPKDYHRVHMPCAGTLVAMQYIPGRLFSVNPASLASINNTFARNERVISIFKTDFGYMAIILVGAMIVGSIATHWHGVVCPPHGHRDPQFWQYAENEIFLKQGDELGYFQMGSTVIALFPKNFGFDPEFIGKEIQFGAPIRCLSS